MSTDVSEKSVASTVICFQYGMMFLLVMVWVVVMIVMIMQFGPVQFLFINILSQQPNGR